MLRAAWAAAFTAAYEDFCRKVDGGCDIGIDPYAAESPAEFFAVVSETYFESPGIVASAYPDVYAQLALFYRQDTVARLAPQERPVLEPSAP